MLRVASTNPANGSVVTVTPGAISVTFNKPINFATVIADPNPADILTFVTTPPGVTVILGKPVPVGDPNFPTTIQFPFSFSKPTGTVANGNYTFTVQSPPAPFGPITSKDGKALVPGAPISFTLNDKTAPEVASTSVFSRQITITFTKAIDPGTITLANFYVQRAGGVPFVNPPTPTTNTNLNSDPRARISSALNSAGQTVVTLDYSGLPQTEMPSDDYRIIINSAAVTDLVGNELDGAFSGSFPSGDGVPGSIFIQDLGPQTLQAPVLTTFQMTAQTDTGIPGDQNTRLTQPVFIGQVFSSFPGTVANLQVLIEFNGLHPELGGGFDLNVGGGGRGSVGTFDVAVTTDNTGKFIVTAPPLPEGFQRAQIVVIGQADQPPLPGFSSAQEHAFRTDQSHPFITVASLANNSTINQLQTLTLQTADISVIPPAPFTYLGTPAPVLFPAIDPTSASNVSNYTLTLLNPNGTTTDESQFITSAVFTAAPPLLDSTGNFIFAYAGAINLTFGPGLPAGNYVFTAHTAGGNIPGLTDAAGNPLASSFNINFAIQSQPVFVTNLAMESSYSNNGSTAIGGPRSYYELPSSRPQLRRPRRGAPQGVRYRPFQPRSLRQRQRTDQLFPERAAHRVGRHLRRHCRRQLRHPGRERPGQHGHWVLDRPEHDGRPVQLEPRHRAVESGHNGGRQRHASGPHLQRRDPLAGRLLPFVHAQSGQHGASVGPTRGSSTFMATSSTASSWATPPRRSTTEFPSQFPNPQFQFQGIMNYEDLLSSGTYRSGMSGDGVAGGAFTTGFVVVPNGNIVYARPDYVEDPLLSSTIPDGSMAKPYSTLAPEGDPSTAPPNPNHDPNGGLNSSQFFLSGFNSNFDRNGNGRFDRSALYAASQLAFNGPVVVVALPGTPQRDPITGNITQQTFVLQAPAGSNPVINNASTSVPFDTTLVFAPGSTLKSQNASLFVQNQGSALEVLGQATSTQRVNFTSYNDASIGGASNGNPVTTPRAGDWGGIVFRSYDQAAQPTVKFPVDVTLTGINGNAIAGADDVMSSINFAIIQYAGGAVPQSSSNFFSAITLRNARPAITNDNIANNGGSGGLQAAIGADMNSFREDDITRGPVIRRATVINNSLNGVWLLAENSGVIEPTNAVPLPDNPSSLGGSQNYTFFEPLPIVALAVITVGQELLENTGGNTRSITNRLYIQPGSMIKINKGAGIQVVTPGASLNVGSRSYINGFDLDSNYGPGSPGFVAESANDPQVLFTSIFDDNAITTLVPTPINVTGETTTPTLGFSMWGSVGIDAGAVAVINHAKFSYGGGLLHTANFSIPSQSVLTFATGFSSRGTHVYITNNDFIQNFDSAMQIDPNGLLAGDPIHPLASGHPFFRGNVMQGNGIDGLGVVTSRVYITSNPGGSYIGPVEAIFAPGGSNQTRQHGLGFHRPDLRSSRHDHPDRCFWILRIGHRPRARLERIRP